MALKQFGRLIVAIMFIAGFVASTVAFQSPQSVYADDSAGQAKCDYDFLENNDIKLHDPCASTCDSSTVDLSNIKNTDYAQSAVLNSADLTQLTNNQAFYQKSADANGIPWQLLAAIHYRETGLRRTGPANGDGPYQIVGSSSPVGDYTDIQFQAATDAAAKFIHDKMGDGYDYTQPDNVKKALFAYNGQGKVYIDQAKALGFTDTQAANGEGSPYVMNRADAKRDPTIDPTKSNNTWGQITQDGGPMVYPATPQYGAYVVYAILAGISGSGGACSISGNGLTLDQAKKFIDRYKAIDNGDPNGDKKYISPAEVCHTNTDNCVALSAFFINKYTDLNVVAPNGSAFVSRLSAKNPGIEVSKTPQPFSIFSVATGVTMCGGIPCGHTGVVLGINPDKDELYTAEAAWCKPGYTNIYVHKLSAWTNAGYSFAYTGSHFKQDVLMRDIQ